MPSIRIGLSTQFNLENEQVGIGTTNPTATLEVIGNIVAEGAAGGSGVSTFREYQGFHQSEQGIANNIVIDNQTGGPFSSLSADLVISGETTISSGSTVEIGKTKTLTVTDKFAVPLGDTNSRDNTPEAGTTRFNQDFGTLEFFDGNNWKTVNSYARGGAAGRGVFGGGYVPGSGVQATIDLINISSTGNVTNFGSLFQARRNNYGCSSSIRGVFGAGYAAGGNVNTVDYITIASEGNAIDFGDTTQSRHLHGSCSSSTRGIFGGGATPSIVNTIDYITISTIGNALDFGDLFTGRYGVSACSSSTRAVFGAGSTGGGGVNSVSTVDFITVSSTGNSTSFGNLTQARAFLISCSNSTRGVFVGGITPTFVNTIDHITIASTGNAIDFGDLTQSRAQIAGCSSNIRGVFGGGYIQPAFSNVIDYITISTTGDALDFGDLSQIRGYGAALSDSHGGLGGF